MSRVVIILLGLLALALLVFLCVRNHSTTIQTDIQNRISNSLSTEPTTWAKASTDGRNVLLLGFAPSEALRNKAEDIARAVPGVVSVDNQIQLAKAEQASIPKPEPIYSPYKTQFNKTESGITLSGLVPDQEKRNVLVQLAENKFGMGNVIDHLKIGMGAPENWLQTATAAISNLTLFKEGNIEITDTQLKLTGRVINNDAKKTIADSLNQLPKTFSVNLDFITPQIAIAELKDSSSQVPTPPPPPCADQFEQLFTDDRVIFFPTDGFELSSQSRRIIGKVLKFSLVCPNSIIEVAGYTDSKGNEPYNLTLSNDRANAVAEKLIQNGFPANMLKVKGFGESNPSSDNKTEQGQANNRRIEFRYLQERE